MTTIDISDEMMIKLKEFKKVVDIILSDEPIENESEYVELVISQGLGSMIKDILPQEEPTLVKTMALMFNENPQFVSKFIAETLIRGTVPKEQVKEKWGPYA